MHTNSFMSLELEFFLDSLRILAKLLQSQSSLIKDYKFVKRKTFIKSWRSLQNVNFKSSELHNCKRNSQMSRRPIFISDSRDTKEWLCFVGQIFFQAYFILRTCLPNYVRKNRKKPICKVTFNTMGNNQVQSCLLFCSPDQTTNS